MGFWSGFEKQAATRWKVEAAKKNLSPGVLKKLDAITVKRLQDKWKGLIPRAKKAA